MYDYGLIAVIQGTMRPAPEKKTSRFRVSARMAMLRHTGTVSGFHFAKIATTIRRSSAKNVQRCFRAPSVR
jgi:hypothetical protein